MKVGVLCEFSGRVRDAFIRRGHDAVSCDLIDDETETGPHLKGDCLSMDWGGYDLLICHPPCTYLAGSGAAFFNRPGRRALQAEAVEFCRRLLALPVPRIALENPVGVLSTRIRKPDQIIHPYQFGHAEKKATCFWLKGLPLLRPTMLVTPVGDPMRAAPPHAERWKLRSRTYTGIAAAMAHQWGRI